MRKALLAGLILLMSTGCAISEMKRVNMRLKEDNDQLLIENRQLRARAQEAEQLTATRLKENEQLRQDLAIALRQGAGTAEEEPSAERGVTVMPSAFKDITEVDVAQERDGIRLTLSERVFFEPGSATINSKGKAILARVAAILKRDYAGKPIRVEGHTDSTPINKSRDKYPTNWELSTARACAVTRELESQNITPENLTAAGYSLYRPVASNTTDAGRQQNRRVEIRILNK